MASSSDNISMAVFCDFENVALGVRDANYEKFDIQPVLERLLLKGSIVVKKAYCDWERYKGFKAAMHESNFELIEIPHVRQSGKNSADIRLVVDALDLCYTKSHVNTFVIISGDSDFSPLVSKLRENNKHVIAVGVKQSTSDLLVANCDEFIFYDDLVREVKRTVAKREERKARPQPEKRPQSDESNRRKEELEARKSLALEMVVETFDALVSERGDSKIWASLLKDTLKRRRPDFNESYFGFSTFGRLLEEAQSRGLLEFGRDEKSGAYVYRSQNAAPSISIEAGADEQSDATGDDADAGQAIEAAEAPAAPVNGRNNRPPQQDRPRSRTSFRTPVVQAAESDEELDEDDAEPAIEEDEDQAQPQSQPQQQRQQNPRGRNRGRDRERQPADTQAAAATSDVPAPQPKQQQNGPKQKDARGRGRGRNGDRLPADAQPGREPNRERTPSDAQPKSHENALPPELRGRGRNRGPRNQNAVPYPEASAERAFHEQQQRLEAAAAAAGRYDEPEPAPEPSTVEEALGQVDAATPAASERRRAPRKTAAQKAAGIAAANVGSAAGAEQVAPAAEPATPATMDALPDAEVNGNVANVKPARKTAPRKAPARAAAAKPADDAPAAEAPAAEAPAAEAPAAAKPAARPRRPAKPKADQA